MESEAESEASSVVSKLALFPVPPSQSPDRSGMLTPPLQTLASVPFRWEEKPGKPLFLCPTLTALSKPFHKSLELPPKLWLMDARVSILENPEMGGPRFGSSLRMMSGSSEGDGSFGQERGRLGALVLRKRGAGESGLLGAWGKMFPKGKKEAAAGSVVFPSSLERESGGSGGCLVEGSSSVKVRLTRIRRNGSFSNHSQARPYFWTSMIEGLRQAVPWRGKKLKKEGS